MFILKSRAGTAVKLLFLMALALPAWSANAADRLDTGQSLPKGQSLTSPDGKSRLVLQQDNNLVVYASGKAIWSTGTNSSVASKLVMQTDGNLVLYTSGSTPIWNTQTHGSGPGVKAVMQNDGNFVLYTSAGTPIWDSKGFVRKASSSTGTVSAGNTASTGSARGVDFARFYDGLRRSYGSLNQSQVRGIDVLLTKMQADTRPAINDRTVWIRQIAYLFATVKHEVANTYLPITEYSNTTCTRYDGGCRYKGRGYVQLTHLYNYRKLSPIVGADLVASPEKALDPNIAYTVMSHGMYYGLFTSRKLGTYIRSGLTDYVNARRVVNGTDKASLLAGYARTFQGILEGSAR